MANACWDRDHPLFSSVLRGRLEQPLHEGPDMADAGITHRPRVRCIMTSETIYPSERRDRLPLLKSLHRHIGQCGSFEFISGKYSKGRPSVGGPHGATEDVIFPGVSGDQRTPHAFVDRDDLGI